MSIITLPTLTAKIATSGQLTTETVKALISALTESVGEMLKAEGEVVIPHVGTFRAINLGDSTTIEFAPDRTLADEINAPFAMFSPIELPDNATEADIEAGIDPDFDTDDETGSEAEIKSPEPQTDNLPTPPPIPQRHPAVDDVENETIPAPEYPSALNQADETVENPPTENEAPQPIVQPIEKIVEKERIVEVPVKPPHYMLYTIVVALLTLIAGIVIGYFMSGHVNFGKVKSVNIETEGVNLYHIVTSDTTIMEPGTTPAEADSINSVGQNDSIASQVPVKTNNLTTKTITDTVRADRFLTTMALEHYGKKKFWVYIYKENQSILNDPDNIAPNTVVIIPPAEKYGIKPGDKQSEADAERLAEEIFSKNQ